MEQPFDYIEMKIPAKPEYVGVMRLTLSGIASRMGFTYEDIEDLKVAASEACTNAVHHAYDDNEGGEVTIGFGVYENQLEVMVSDSGKSFNVQEMKKTLGPYNSLTTIDEMNEGGLGLFLIETLMDDVKIQSLSGVTVLMTKYLHRERVDHGEQSITTNHSE
ncbi:anti-sigma B factor RsbW [Bacillus salitolerans]|uniref:Serine-protein kinase RsbW n=1 Tax=Bacillus salitolerans TaxID=1437434 RepID=A0ABW4LRA8_9BACI